MVRRFALQLVQPVQTTEGDTKVRIWCDFGDQPAVTAEEWEELPIEIVPDQDALPALVVQGGLDRALPISLTRMPASASAGALVERTLVRVDINDLGLQSYRSRFLICQLNSRLLDIDLWTLLPRSMVEARLAGNVVPCQMVDELGREVDIGKRLRLTLQPHLIHTPVLLDLRYEVDRSRSDDNGFLRSTFHAPQIQNSLLIGRLRWDIHLPAGWLAVYASAPATPEQRWGWSGWLPGPQPALSATGLEQWIQKAERNLPIPPYEAGFIASQTRPEPLHLLQAPLRIWLLLCSLLVLGVGFLLFFAGLSRWVFWSFLCGLAAAVAVLEVLWPGVLLQSAFAAQPGIIVLAIVVVTYVLLRYRHRRRVVLMPGFTRIKTGSSITPGSDGARREVLAGEQSPKRSSSVSSKVGA
jgi:hypothetical protein